MAPPSSPDDAAALPADGVVLIVGLGNPGPAHAGNRHNVGFLVADVLAERVGGRFKRHKSGPDVVEGRLGGRQVVLAKPRSFMNLVGAQVAGVARFYKTSPAALVVLHDELDLPFGTLRIKAGGGEGGHNGLRSISKSLSSKDYLRLRFGIGRPPGRMDPADYVLRDFTTAERQELPILLNSAADLVEHTLAA